MTVYATVEQVAAKWQRTLTPAQEASADVLLEEGSALLRAQVPGLDAGLAAVPPTVEAVLVRKVLTDAVLRVLRNPAGVVTQVVGPESATFSGQAARAELAFLPAELAMVTPADDSVSVAGYAIGSVSLGIPGYCGSSLTSGTAYDVERFGSCW